MPNWDNKTSDMLHDEHNIKGFTGEYRWLSNFWPVLIKHEGISYPSVENMYQANKTLDMSIRAQFTTLSAGQAKKLGRKILVREDWNSVKDNVMMTGLLRKFGHPELREKLVATGDKYLEETNWWGDTYWGVCKGVGKNKLGEMINQIRATTRYTEHDPSPYKE